MVSYQSAQISIPVTAFDPLLAAAPPIVSIILSSRCPTISTVRRILATVDASLMSGRGSGTPGKDQRDEEKWYQRDLFHGCKELRKTEGFRDVEQSDDSPGSDSIGLWSYVDTPSREKFDAE